MRAPILSTRTIRALRDPLLHDHKFAIPKLQRNFVWDAGRAAKLLDSIYYQMPIGSLFLWEMNQKSANLIRQATGVLPSFNPKNKTISFVIDGQQRLSVIYQAFKGERRENDAGQEIDFGRLCFVVNPDPEAENPPRIVHRKPSSQEYVALSAILDTDWKKNMPSKAKWFLGRIQNCRNRFLRLSDSACDHPLRYPRGNRGSVHPGQFARHADHICRSCGCPDGATGRAGDGRATPP